jgi:hypothetical protein
MHKSGKPRSNMKNKLPSLHWQFPAAAKFGRVIPKEKLYSQVNANAELKQLFVSQIAQIKWAYKLAESTINLAKTEQVEEIEIIQIKLKTENLDEKLLAAIDKAIPHPTIFLLQRQQQGQEQGQTEISYQAAYKQKVIAGKDTSTSNAKKTIKATKGKWNHSNYLQSAWLAADNTAALPLPAATTLQGLYQCLLEALLPQLDSYNLASYQVPEKTAASTEALGINETLTGKAIEDSGLISKSPTILKTAQPPSLQEKLAALAKIEALNKQLAQVKNKRDKEKQFNRRQALNDQFKRLAAQLDKLKAAFTN